MKPDVDKVTGIPRCPKDESCDEYDGKRCRILGCRPDCICEPAVEEIVSELRALRAARKDG